MKILRAKIFQTPKTEERIRYEIQALQLLNEVRDRNSKIVRFYGVFEDEKYTTIVMEYCKEGSLRNYIFRRRKKLSNTSGNEIEYNDNIWTYFF